MYKLVVALIGSLALLPMAACGQKAATSPATAHASARADVAAHDQASGSVWLVESATTRLYLCGTIHLLRRSDYPLPTDYERAYADSTRLVFELPPGTSRDPKLAETMRAQGSYPEGQALTDHVKPAAWDALSQWASDRGLNAGVFNRYRPWFVALTVSATEYAALGAEPDRGVDQTFEKRADKDGKPGEGLETLDLQMGLFTRLSETQQAELLEQTLAEVKSLPDQFQRMITAWRGGDVEELHQMLFEEAEKYPELLDTFLIQRNLRWIKQLEGYLAGRERVMVLVGTGHLGGKEGLIDLLKTKGYQVRKLTEASPAVAR